MKLIDKNTLVTEIERLKANALQKKCKCKRSGLERIMHQIGAYNKILSFLNILEVKEVDLEKEIQDHINECLDIKFPTTNIELIKKDVAYTARKFFELGFKAQKGE